MRSHQTYLLLASIALTTPLAAGILNVPGDYPTIQEAAKIAASGDTVLVAPGTHGVFGELILQAGVTLRGAAGRDSTTVEIVLEGDQIRLASGSVDTTRVEGLRFLVRTAYQDAVVAESPAVAIRRNAFADIGAGSSASIVLTNGGRVEDNLFWAGFVKSVSIRGGTSIIRGNTWNHNCGFPGAFAVSVVPSSSSVETVRVELRGNTVVAT